MTSREQSGPTHSQEIEQALNRSIELSHWLNNNLPDRIQHKEEVDDAGRVRSDLAARLLSIALDHHVSLVFLVLHHKRGGAFALLRSVFDATWRGAWVAYAALPEQVDGYLNGKYDPTAENGTRALDKVTDMPNVFSRLKKQSWSTMSAYAHGGTLQVQRWARGSLIGPAHSDEETIELLDAAGLFAMMSAFIMVDVCGAENAELTARFLAWQISPPKPHQPA